MRTIAVIQARLNSTRLPRKILLPIAGKSMLQNIVERVQRAKLIDRTIVACPMNDWRTISMHCFAGVSGYDGDENDVIGRLLSCAKDFQADAIIRVCADNPCVEPEEIDSLVAKLAEYESDVLLMNSENPRLDYDGFGGELYATARLEWMDETIKSPKYREHPHKFWIDMNCFSYCGKHYWPGFRLDVNTQSDYEKVKSIYDHFGHNHFTVAEAIEFLGKKNLEERDLPA